METDGDIDFFSFSAVAGQPYLFEVALNSLPNSALEVFDASGSSLNYNDDVRPDILSSLIRFISTTSQTVFLGVSGSASTDRGSYALSVFTDDHSDTLAFATPIEPDSVTPGEIETAFDVDIFSFSVAMGQTYIFEGTAGTLTSVGLVITDLAQNLIARNTLADPGTPLEYTAEATGTLLIAVLGPGTGTYTLGFSTDPLPLTFTVDPLGEAQVGVAYEESFCRPAPEPGLFCGGPLQDNPGTFTPTGGTPNYTFSIDGVGFPSGLSLHLNGLITGTPSEGAPTGRRNFRICARDQAGDRACQDTFIIVNPAKVVSLNGTWSGIYDSTSTGDGGCVYNNEGSLRMTITTSGTSVSGSAFTNGLEARYLPACTYAFDTDSSGTVTGTIDGDVWTLNFTFPGSITTHTFRGTGTLTGSTITGEYIRTNGNPSIGAFTLTLR